MDILYTSFLQRLVQASNSIKYNEDHRERELLELLTHLQKIVRAQETIIKEFSRQGIAQHTVADPA